MKDFVAIMVVGMIVCGTVWVVADASDTPPTPNPVEARLVLDAVGPDGEIIGEEYVLRLPSDVWTPLVEARQRVAELEAELAAAQARIAELEAALAEGDVIADPSPRAVFVGLPDVITGPIPSPTVEGDGISGVVFRVNGESVREEGFAPWSLAGDRDGQLLEWHPPPGEHVVEALITYDGGETETLRKTVTVTP